MCKALKYCTKITQLMEFCSIKFITKMPGRANLETGFRAEQRDDNLELLSPEKPV